MVAIFDDTFSAPTFRHVIRIVSLHIYPVKSMKGIAVDRSELDHSGLRWDRRWMMTDGTGMFISQREIAEMTRMTVRLDNHALILQAPDGQECRCALDSSTRRMRSVTVWDDTCDAEDEGDEVAKFLSSVFGRPCRLVRMPDAPTRRVDSRYSPEGATVHFGDAMPIHIVNLASLRVLNERLEQPVGIDRFRANIVIDGEEAFAEDHWRRLHIAEKEFRFCKTTGRCVMTTIDQESAQSSKEPLRSLAEFRTVNNRTLFGMYVLQPRPGGELHVGDEVHIDEVVQTEQGI